MAYAPRRFAIIDGYIAKIPLGKNAKDGYTIVDKEYSFLEKHLWYLDHGYARTMINGKLFYLHRLIIPNLQVKQVVDHINRNTLDNRRVNIRATNQTQNLFNGKLRKDNTSGYKGISWDRTRRKWKVGIKNRNIGRFSTLEEALITRRNLEKEAIE